MELQHQCFSEYSRLISCRIDWFDLLAVQERIDRLILELEKHTEYQSKSPSLKLTRVRFYFFHPILLSTMQDCFLIGNVLTVFITEMIIFFI